MAGEGKGKEDDGIVTATRFWLQANLSSGKCIQMNVIILSNILVLGDATNGCHKCC